MCTSRPQNLKLVPNWPSKNNLWVTKLYRCSFQAPHASPRPRPMETYISINFLLVLSFIIKIIYMLSLFDICLEKSPNSPARVGHAYFCYHLSSSSVFFSQFLLSSYHYVLGPSIIISLSSSLSGVIFLFFFSLHLQTDWAPVNRE